MTSIGKLEMRGRQMVFVCEEPDSRKPVMRRWVWPVINGRQTGLGRKPDAEVFAREARSVGDGEVSVYLGDGVYYRAVMPEGGRTKAIEMSDTPIPAPRKCRNRIWIWKEGKWQKKMPYERECAVAFGYHVAT